MFSVDMVWKIHTYNWTIK